jgi:hypothetical protein
MKRKYVRKISAIIASGITASTLPLVVSSCSCGTTNKTTTYTLLPSIDILNQTDNLSTINAYKNNVNYNPIS